MKTNKYSYNKLIQQNYGQGWEDASEYSCNSKGAMTEAERALLKHDLKEYKLLGYPTRIIFRKELATAKTTQQ